MGLHSDPQCAQFILTVITYVPEFFGISTAIDTSTEDGREQLRNAKGQLVRAWAMGANPPASPGSLVLGFLLVWASNWRPGCCVSSALKFLLMLVADVSEGEAVAVSDRRYHCCWSSPAVALLLLAAP